MLMPDPSSKFLRVALLAVALCGASVAAAQDATYLSAREAAKGHFLPAHMPGGPENPLGARALYLGSTLYRIHGTNAPWSIGNGVSSGCIRMRNEDVTDLYERVKVGTKDLAIFTRQFSVMLDAGLPLVQCLEILGEQEENKKFGEIIGALNVPTRRCTVEAVPLCQRRQSGAGPLAAQLRGD